MTKRSSLDRRRAEGKGRLAEGKAEGLLVASGFEILARRFKTSAGEIDLIAAKENLIAFIEVKARATMDDALWSLTPTGQKRIGRSAVIWLANHRPNFTGTVRYDLIAVTPEAISHVEDAFRPDDGACHGGAESIF